MNGYHVYRPDWGGGKLLCITCHAEYQPGAEACPGDGTRTCAVRRRWSAGLEGPDPQTPEGGGG